MKRYEIVFGMAKSEKELPTDFSFCEGRFREVLNEKIEVVNTRGKSVANPKSISIINDKTTKYSLVILLESQEKLDVPTRGCKALSRELSLTMEFSSVLAGGGPKGKLFVGKDWFEVPSNEEIKNIEGPEMMKILTKMLMRQNITDKKIIAEIGKILIANEYMEEE